MISSSGVLYGTKNVVNLAILVAFLGNATKWADIGRNMATSVPLNLLHVAGMFMYMTYTYNSKLHAAVKVKHSETLYLPILKRIGNEKS